MIIEKATRAIEVFVSKTNCTHSNFAVCFVLDIVANIEQ